ncbi:hypothetical protein [Halobaculum sp. EA56]|uniref:hypothetical protein n=1 Tax=Halobaculum sp. EA56 TaxID=3421648 RepID=UPI003EBF96DF
MLLAVGCDLTSEVLTFGIDENAVFVSVLDAFDVFDGPLRVLIPKPRVVLVFTGNLEIEFVDTDVLEFPDLPTEIIPGDS